MSSFSDLLNIHRELDEEFAQHQYALLHFDFDRAEALLRSYLEKLRDHMRHEEEALLPMYAERAHIDPAGATELFLTEHEKMLSWIQLFFEAIAELRTDPKPEAKLLKLLDRESFYLKLCSHHDTREARFLYPGLDAVTTEEERATLL